MSAKRMTQRQTEARRAIKLIRRIQIGFSRQLDEELRPERLTTAQLRLLHEVRMHPGASGAQLARACYVTPQTAQAMLTRAVREGWVARGKDVENDRLVTARLTAEGERILEYAGTILRRIEAKAWKGVGIEDLLAFNQVLEGVVDRVEALSPGEARSC